MELDEDGDFQVALQAFAEDVEKWTKHWIGPGGLKSQTQSEVLVLRNPNPGLGYSVAWRLTGFSYPVVDCRVRYDREWWVGLNGNITDTCVDPLNLSFSHGVGNLKTGWKEAEKHFYSNYSYMNVVKKYRSPRKSKQLMVVP